MKNFLFVTYHFPPFGGGGVQRPLKFVKYLPDFGWQPVVLTIREFGRKHYAYDGTMRSEIPLSTKIHRAYAYDLLLDTIEETANKIGIGKLTRLFRFPDHAVLWSLPTMFSAYHLIKKYKLELLFTTSPPWSINLIGVILKKLLDIKWVADHRDAWTGGWKFDLPETTLGYKWHHKLESLSYQYSDLIIANTPGFKREIVREFGLDDGKVEAITNGYDEEDFVKGLRGEGIKGQNASRITHHAPLIMQKFNIVYTGTYYNTELSNLFLTDLKELSKEKIDFRNDVHVSLVGNIDEEIIKKISEHELTELISVHDYLPHVQSVSLIQQAELLLLMTETNPKAKICVPGKAYEYIRSGTPILALVDKDGDCADIIRSTRTGVVADHRDIDSIKNAMYRSYCRWKESKKVDVNWQEVQKYERRNLTEKLVKAFDRL